MSSERSFKIVWNSIEKHKNELFLLWIFEKKFNENLFDEKSILWNQSVKLNQDKIELHLQ